MDMDPLYDPCCLLILWPPRCRSMLTDRVDEVGVQDGLNVACVTCGGTSLLVESSWYLVGYEERDCPDRDKVVLWCCGILNVDVDTILIIVEGDDATELLALQGSRALGRSG